jgi:hypothetical protein
MLFLMGAVICCSTEFKHAASAIIDSIRVTAAPAILFQLLRRTGERLFCISVLLEIHEDIGSYKHFRCKACLAYITAYTCLAMEPLT